MTNKEIISMVKNNIHHYECTSLANDDVERLFVVIERMQKQNNKLKKPLGTEMADAFDKIIEPSEPNFCICCEEITEENAHLHRNCGK